MVTRRASVATIDDRLLQAERVRLVRLCYRLTGNLDVAEDLTQETLFEAMRNAHKVYDAAGYGRWLSAIARNVCRRWNERQGRQVAQQRSLRTPHATGDAGGDDLDVPDVDYDLDIELNRRELVVLLDRALILLPDESRAVLIER